MNDINPATGLPMNGSGFDIAGNPYGVNNSVNQIDPISIRQDDSERDYSNRKLSKLEKIQTTVFIIIWFSWAVFVLYMLISHRV